MHFMMSKDANSAITAVASLIKDSRINVLHEE